MAQGGEPVRVMVDFTGPVGGDTGGATYARYFLPELLSLGLDEVTTLFSHGQVPGALSGLPGVVQCMARSSLPGPASHLVDRNVAFPRLAERLKPQVAYFPGNFVSVGLPPDLPAVVAIRSMLLYHYPGQVSLQRRTYRRLVTSHAIRRADRIIVPSSVTADDLMQRLDVKRWRIVVVPHGVDLEAFVPPPAPATEPNRFVFVSKPWDYKGLATVLRALPQVRSVSPGVQLRIADGGLPQVDVLGWQRIAESLGVSDVVRFLGHVSHAQLRDEYQRACALVLPVSIESFGNAFLEAAACGCAVITGSGFGIDETIGPVATQVPAHRHYAVAEAMIGHIRMGDAQRAERAAASRAWAERFPWRRTVAETRQVLAEAGSGAPGHGRAWRPGG